MTREEQVAFCRKCTNRKFDTQQGLICRLTDKKADFQDSCPDFNLDEYVKENRHEPQSQLEALEMIDQLSEESINKLREYQDFPAAIIGGLLLTLIGALIWAAVSVITQYQIGYMAIGIGVMVGFGVRYFGAGVDRKFGILAAVLSVFSCLLGNFFAQIGFVAQAQGLTYLQTIKLFDYSLLPDILSETFSPMDIVFYAIAIGAAFKYSYRKVSPEELELMHEQQQDPVPPGYQFRKPVVIAASVAILGFIFIINRGEDGSVTFKYEDGTAMSEGNMVNGKEDGEWAYWYPSGRKQAEVSYANGVPHGFWTLFYESGKKMTEGSYANGNQVGLWINYYPEGQVSDSGRYEMGRQQSDWAYYFENGQLMQSGPFQSGRQEGIWKSFFDNGQVESEGEMSYGQPTGVWKSWTVSGEPKSELEIVDSEALVRNAWDHDGKQTVINGNGSYHEYFETGELMSVCEVQNGKRHGKYVAYHVDGSKEQEGTYDNGKYRFKTTWKPDGTPVIVNGNGRYEYYPDMGLIATIEGDVKDGYKNGTWYTYYPSGDIQSSTVWVAGEETGKQTTFYENGNTWTEGVMTAGKQTGEWKWYFEDGTIETIANFVDGKKEGIQSFWGITGDKIKDEVYENDKLIETRPVQ